MKYQFPTINHIDDVLPHVKDHPDFLVAERDFGTVVNYNVITGDTFRPINSDLSTPEAEMIKRECRGLIFAKDGSILSRPFHKFFNIDEREETLLDNVDFSKPHVILEKLDGSMVRPIWTKAVYLLHPSYYMRLATKMGITEVAMQAEVWVATRKNYLDFIEHMRESEVSPIFEWCSRQNRVVIDHPVERLVLIAIRHNKSGEYVPYDHMKQIADLWNVECVKAFQIDYATTGQQLVEFISKHPEGEGVVLRFDDGHMVKIKTDQYVALHKLRDNILREKNVIPLILDQQIDDIRGKLLPQDKVAIETFEDAFIRGLNERGAFLEQNAELYYKLERKQFALEHAPTLGILGSVIFKSWGNVHEIRDNLVDLVRKKTQTQASIDENRWIWGGAKYEPNSMG